MSPPSYTIRPSVGESFTFGNRPGREAFPGVIDGVFVHTIMTDFDAEFDLTNAEKVAQFSRAMGQDTPSKPIMPDDKILALRLCLMDEELTEVTEAIFSRKIPDIAKELADLLYVVYGTAIAYGIPIDDVFAEVHRSNMTKLDPVTGKPIVRADGKVLKPSTYEPADIEKVLG